jgi:hypothetical protein
VLFELHDPIRRRVFHTLDDGIDGMDGLGDSQIQ